MNRRNAMQLILAPIMLGVVPGIAKESWKVVLKDLYLASIGGFPIMYDVNGKRMSQLQVNKCFRRAIHLIERNGNVTTYTLNESV